MRISSAPLDDVHGETLFVLELRNTRQSRMCLCFVHWLYRLHRWALLFLLRSRG